jgi:hypothetical protein
MNTRIPWIVAAVLAAVSVFLGVKLQEKPREVIKEVPVDRVVEKQVEVIKEVPKEVVREVVKEVVKEVPVEVVKVVEKPIAPEYAAQREMGLKLQKARFVPLEQKLQGVTSVYVAVTIPDEIKGSTSEASIKGKIEAELRKAGIAVVATPSATDHWLTYNIEVLKGESIQALSYITSLNLLSSVYVSRAGDISKTTALVWTSGNFGAVGLNEGWKLGEIYERDLSAFITAQGKANARRSN